MARRNIVDSEYNLIGWFDDKAKNVKRFNENTYFNGNNHISKATKSQWVHETLYLTAKGTWVLNHDATGYSGADTYTKISDDQAARWLVTNDCEDDKGIPEDMIQLIEAMEL
jgi:hypothetical protein